MDENKENVKITVEMEEEIECPDCGSTDVIIQGDEWVCPICLRSGNIFQDFFF